MTDPRYDPSFQRGYDGPPPKLVVRARSRAPKAAAAEEPAPEGIPDPNPEPVAQRLEPEARSIEEAPVARRVNPYTVALLIAGVLATAAGTGMLVRSATDVTQYGGASDTTGLVLQLLTLQLAPALIVGGAILILAWLVLGALSALFRRGR
jgi:hypothetical protein